MRIASAELCEVYSLREYAFELPQDGIDMQGTEFMPTEALRVTLGLRREGDSIHVQVVLRGALRAPCARCLTNTEDKIDIAVTEQWPLCAQNEETTDFLSSPFIEDDGRLIDLVAYASGLMIEHLPLRALCSADCRGLCHSCGTNFNESSCDCRPHKIDPRLAVLGRLLHDEGGVRDGVTKKKNL